MTAATLPQLLNVEELAEYLGYSRDRVLRLLKAGRIPGVKRNGRWFIRVEDVARWLEPATNHLEVAS